MQLPAKDREKLQKMLRIGAEQAASTLNAMLRSPVELSMPEISLLRRHELTKLDIEEGEQTSSIVSLGFKSNLSGTALLVLPQESATRLVEILVGGRSINTAEKVIHIAAITEVGNILLSGLLGAVANELHRNLVYTSTPTYVEDRLLHLLQRDLADPEALLVLAHAQMQTPGLQIQGTAVLLFHEVLF